MAHLVYQVNGKDSMAYVGEKPWHGLGTEVQPGQSLENWIIEAQMDWTVEMAPVNYSIPEAGFRESDIMFEMDSRQVLYRSDNFMPLAVVSDRFKPVQPSEIIEFYRDLVEDHGFELETAGSLDDGKRLWALAKTGKDFTLAGGDKVEGYLLLFTANDGTLATTATFTAIRVVCNNTLSMARSAADKSDLTVKVPHNAIFNPTSVKMDLGIYEDNWDQYVKDCNRLAATKLSQDQLVKYFISIFHSPDNKDAEGKESFDDVPKRTLHKLLDLTLEGQGVELESANGTLWGAYNAVTEHYDHNAGRTKDSGLRSAWFGNGANVKQTAYEKAIAIAIDIDGNEVEVEVDRPVEVETSGGLLDDIISATVAA